MQCMMVSGRPPAAVAVQVALDIHDIFHSILADIKLLADLAKTLAAVRRGCICLALSIGHLQFIACMLFRYFPTVLLII